MRILETHDTTTTEIIRNVTSSDGKVQYHGQWMSGPAQTTILGVPDTELITPLSSQSYLHSRRRETVGHRGLEALHCF